MSTQSSAYAIIVAGGSGTRMGTLLPKQFMDLCGKPVLYYSVRAFIDALGNSVKIILVLPEQQRSFAQIIQNAFSSPLDLIIVTGGNTRYASVAAGLKEVPANSIVLVHDGARPLVSPELIGRCYEGARLNGSAVPVVPVTDSIRQVTSNSSKAVAREKLRSVQTPQAFDAALLHEAYCQPYVPTFTDEASVVEQAGNIIHLVEGDRSNLKITTPEDFVIAEALLRQKG